jgi:hypothetical protein
VPTKGSTVVAARLPQQEAAALKASAESTGMTRGRLIRVLVGNYLHRAELTIPKPTSGDDSND